MLDDDGNTPNDDDEEESSGLDESADETEDDDDIEAGGGEESDDSDEGESEESGVVRPTGRDLLELLASDPVAQKLMTDGLSELQRRQAAEAAAQKDAEEFSDLVKNEDYAEIGRRMLERQRKAETRTTVADEVLKEQFGPVYTKLFAEPEMQNLTAEEREALHPDKFESDATYVAAISNFVAEKRHNAAFEAEVERRIAERAKATKNGEIAGKVAKPAGKTPPSMAEAAAGKRTSTDLIKSGLRRIFEPDSVDDDET